MARVPRLALILLQAADHIQGLLGQLTFVRHVQIKELAMGVGHTADFTDALFKPGFVASEVVADQLAVPVAQEVARMFASTAWAEVVNRRFEGRKWRRAIGPDMGRWIFFSPGASICTGVSSACTSWWPSTVSR